MDSKKWEFDAPQYVDFTQPQLYEHLYDDTWFDRHTEDDDFAGDSKEAGHGSAEKHQMKKPQRVLKGGPVVTDETRNEKVEPMEIEGRLHSDSGAKAARTGAEKHEPERSTNDMCPSPKKRQKLSAESLISMDSSPPAANTRLQRNSPIVKASSEPEIARASPRLQLSSGKQQTKSPNTRSQAKSVNKKFNPIKSFVNKLQGIAHTEGSASDKKASSGSAKKAAVGIPKKPARHPTNKPLPKAVSTGSLFSKQEVEKRSTNDSGKGKLSEKDSRGPPSATKAKSTEELELEKINAMKKELARTRKLAQESYKKAMTAQGYMPVRSAQPATLPQRFHFKTDERLKKIDKQAHDEKVRDFAKSLREALPQSALPTKPQVHGLTRPQPFKLTSAKSTTSVPQAGKYESVAEKVAAFHKRTPDRFRSQPHNKERSRSATKHDNSGNERRLRSQSPKLTVAKTPCLTTRGRSRPVHALSREEKEQLEYEEHQKQQFKAHPVNRKVFEAPFIPKAEAKPLTVSEEFNLHYKKSASVGDLRKAAETEEQTYQFHAKPVDPRIFAGPVGVKPVEPQPPTVPESPAFALKNRVRLVVEPPTKEEIKAAIKVNPVPYTGVPFRPRLAHHCTVPEPFSVEERSKEMLMRREQKIQHVLEEEKRAREFHAQDLPSDSPDALPPRQLRPMTKPEPFHLEVDERGQKYQEEFKSKIEEEERTAIEAARFKARPVDVIHKEPFRVQKSSRPLTEISDFALNTDVRAAQRELYDQHLKAREAELEALKRQREEEREREEKAAVAKMRQEAVHKATGIKKYKSVVVMPSDKPVTEPQSPRFSQRIRAKHNNSD